MTRMAEINIDGNFICPVCRNSDFYHKMHREATTWLEGLFGNHLPERIELTCFKCGYISYVLPSDMIGKW